MRASRRRVEASWSQESRYSLVKPPASRTGEMTFRSRSGIPEKALMTTASLSILLPDRLEIGDSLGGHHGPETRNQAQGGDRLACVLAESRYVDDYRRQGPS